MSRKSGIAAFCLAVATLLAFQPAAAQSDVLLRLQSGANDRFKADSAGGLVANGAHLSGSIPATGGGSRLMWHPNRSAFRAGRVLGTQWDHASIGNYSWAGGLNSIASGDFSLAFGDSAVASGGWAVALGMDVAATNDHGIAIGGLARASGFYGIALGNAATASNSHATAIGSHTVASGLGSVAMGYYSTANANFSVSIGARATAAGYTGAITLADAAVTDSVQATANNQFSVRAAGGVRLFTNATLTSGQTLSAGGSTWNAVSDRNRKQDFLEVNGEELLARLRGVPVTTWRYRAEEDRTVRHIGPMAQDWEAAFGFSHDTTMINTGDLDGVNLAGVKALEERTARQAAQLRAQEAQIQAQDEQLRALAREVAELRALVRQKAQQPADPAWP